MRKTPFCQRLSQHTVTISSFKCTMSFLVLSDYAAICAVNQRKLFASLLFPQSNMYYPNQRIFNYKRRDIRSKTVVLLYFPLNGFQKCDFILHALTHKHDKQTTIVRETILRFNYDVLLVIFLCFRFSKLYSVFLPVF